MDRRFLRPGWFVGHLLVVLAVLVCLRLGWWQWDRTHDADGTVQNLGYAFLWPVFGATFIFMWIRFLRLETLKELEDAEADPAPTDPVTVVVAAPRPTRSVVLSSPVVPDEDDDDPELAAYNRALAALAEKDRRRAP